MAGETSEERIVDLEMRFMQQELAIQELSETVFRQERAIERMERELEALNHQVRIIAPAGSAEADQEERPPHY